MDPITVSATAPAAPAAAQAATPPATPQPDHSAEIAALKAEVESTRQAAEFWRSQRTPAPASAPAADPEPEPEDNTDILDLLATQGAKGFDAFMRKRGYVSQKEVEATVRATVEAKGAQLSTEAELLSNYPDLRNKDSEFFRMTALNYGELKNQGVPEHLAMKLAAQQAELQGIRSGKVKTPAQVATETAAEKEAARLARIKAQSGERQARTADGIGEEGDDELTAAEKHICVAMGISEDAYKARAKKGVQMGGLGRK
jgi:hypothetical protein